MTGLTGGLKAQQGKIPQIGKGFNPASELPWLAETLFQPLYVLSGQFGEVYLFTPVGP
jgi:hypothetical protein